MRPSEFLAHFPTSREGISRSNSNDIRAQLPSFPKLPRHFRSSNKIISNDPITGFQKKYEPYRSTSPLGSKNLKVSEKVNNSLYSSKDYSFHRQTKSNPKDHNYNPITGESTDRYKVFKRITENLSFKVLYLPQTNRPARVTKGLGYKKSNIFS